MEGITIYAQTLKSIESASTQGIRIDLTHVATPCRFRFISCAAFVSYDTLQIIEIQGLPVAQYAAISHVWASAPPKDGILTDRGAFLVDCENRNDGGPISIDVLYLTCLAALHEGASYIVYAFCRPAVTTRLSALIKNGRLCGCTKFTSIATLALCSQLVCAVFRRSTKRRSG